MEVDHISAWYQFKRSQRNVLFIFWYLKKITQLFINFNWNLKSQRSALIGNWMKKRKLPALRCIKSYLGHYCHKSRTDVCSFAKFQFPNNRLIGKHEKGTVDCSSIITFERVHFVVLVYMKIVIINYPGRGAHNLSRSAF